MPRASTMDSGTLMSWETTPTANVRKEPKRHSAGTSQSTMSTDKIMAPPGCAVVSASQWEVGKSTR